MDNCDLSIIYLSILAIIIFKYNKILSIYLKKIIIEKPRITLWQVTHFILYFILGKFCKNNHVFFFMIGLLWELIEKLYGKFTGEEFYWTSDGGNGQITDVIMNILGYHFAHII